MSSDSSASKPRKLVRKSVHVAMFAALGLAGLHSTASAEEWLLAPYLRADIGYSSTDANDANVFDDAPRKFETDPHTGGRFQVGAGLELTRYFRTDVTISYRDNMADLDTFDNLGGFRFNVTDGRHNTSNITTMLAGYIDPFAVLKIDTGNFSPYLQAGVGWARNTTKSSRITSSVLDGKTSDELAWQVGAGLNYALTDSWKVDLSYRYIDMGKARTSRLYTDAGVPDILVEEAQFDLKAHEVLLGLQYQF